MIIYCTICCKRKRKDTKPIDSIERYISGRIDRIYRKSISDNVQFRIFSGKFGLLKPEEKIIFYDERLAQKKMDRIIKILQNQISKEKIFRIVFFAHNPQKHKGWIPYFFALKSACEERKIELEIRNI